jgi:hypothetical protein
MYFKNFDDILYDFDIEAKTGTGVQATAVCDIAGGGVNSVTVTNVGSGYVSATCVFSAPDNGAQGVSATGKVIVIGGQVSSILVLNPGTGYTSTPTIEISSPYGITKKYHKLMALKDITKNIRFRRDVLANVSVYDQYDIVDGETPEIIAEKIYGNALYHWIVMLANDIYDYRADFPLTSVALEQYVTDKYGSGNEYDDHHYIDSNGFVVSSDQAGATSVSNMQYEQDLNEQKRRIKIISPSLINVILKNYKDLM